MTRDDLPYATLRAWKGMTALDLSDAHLGHDAVVVLKTLTSLTSLVMRGSNLGDEAAHAVATLPRLTHLDLSDNDIGDDGARALAGLGRLTHLDLSRNTISDVGARQIGTLPILRSLRLGNNRIGDSGAADLAGLSSLACLSLENNSITEAGARAIAGMSDLVELTLSGNSLGDEGANAVAKLRHLTALDLAGNDITGDGVRGFAALSRLASLDLSHNRIGNEGLESLASLHQLKTLVLARSDVAATALYMLQRLTHLRSLDLSMNDLGDEGANAISKLAQLQILSLSNDSIGDQGARSLAGLDALESLDISNNQIGDKGARSLSALWRLHTIDMGHNMVAEEGAKAFAQLSNLESLDLRANAIGGRGAAALVGSRALSSLNVSHNQIGDAGVLAIASIATLTALSLRNNGIRNEGAMALATLLRLKSLDLHANDIDDDSTGAFLPLTDLRSLNVSSNRIGVIGARRISTLRTLEFLDISHNAIGDSGIQELAKLTNLKSLIARNVRVGNGGSSALRSLTKLHTLALSNNHVGALGASAIATLTNLYSLDLSHNGVSDDGANALVALKSLRHLDLFENKIGADGVRGFDAFRSLVTLDLGHNRIGDSGAKALSALAGLTSLRLRYNHIGDRGAAAILEAWRASRQTHRSLDLLLGGNDVTFLPAEIFENGNAATILAAFARYGRSASRPLNEAKLLVVGNEAVGKTSLVRYLTRNLARDPNETKTLGIATHEKIQTHTWSANSLAPIISIWDFGGQEILHETHKLFLTARSIYVVVLEDRREDDTSIYRWLKTISNRSGDSPILVVINKCDHIHPRLALDESAIMREWPSVIGFFRMSCNPGNFGRMAIVELRRKLLDVLETDRRLKHVRDPFPEPWRRVKELLEQLAKQKRVLEHHDFVGLCTTVDGAEIITDPNEQRALLLMLHDLGTVIAHGLSSEAPAAIQKIRILDPNWLTGAIYKILTSGLVVHQLGELSKLQLGEILDPLEYPAHSWEFILSMMQLENLGLCFPVRDDSEKFIVPEALPRNTPAYDDWPADSLRFCFVYEFLPSGLLPRFIVEAHRYITNDRWRQGAVLKFGDCRVLVRGNLDRKRVDILVSGPQGQRRAALGCMIDHLDRVHALNPESRPMARIPLPDQVDVDVSYEHMLVLEDQMGGDYRYIPEGVRAAYRVGDLLDGVRAARESESQFVQGGASPEVGVLDSVREDALRVLRQSYTGIWGAKVFWLATFTLLPLLVSFKAYSLKLSLATIVYVFYHLCGVLCWMDVNHLVRSSEVFTAQERWVYIDRATKLARLAKFSGVVVLVLLSFTFAAVARLEFGAYVFHMELPAMVRDFLGVP